MKVQTGQPVNKAMYLDDPPEMWIPVYVNGHHVGNLPEGTPPHRIKAQAMAWFDQALIISQEASRTRPTVQTVLTRALRQGRL